MAAVLGIRRAGGPARPLVFGLCAVLIAIAAGRNVAAWQHAIHLAGTMPAVETPTVPDALHHCRQDLKPLSYNGS